MESGIGSCLLLIKLFTRLIGTAHTDTLTHIHGQNKKSHPEKGETAAYICIPN